MPVKIRPYHTDDTEYLKELYLRVRIETFYWEDPKRFDLEDLEKDTPEEEIMIAEIDGAVAGFISVWPPESFVHHLYIDKTFRGKGIGRLLLDDALKKYPRPLKLKCPIQNDPAIQFYKKLGWEVLEEAMGAFGPYYLMQSK